MLHSTHVGVARMMMDGRESLDYEDRGRRRKRGWLPIYFKHLSCLLTALGLIAG